MTYAQIMDDGAWAGECYRLCCRHGGDRELSDREEELLKLEAREKFRTCYGRAPDNVELAHSPAGDAYALAAW